MSPRGWRISNLIWHRGSRLRADAAEAGATPARAHLVLVTGATGRVGRAVVAQLLGAGVPVRARTRRPAAARLPAAVEVVAGDLTVPESLGTRFETETPTRFGDAQRDTKSETR